MTDSFHPGLSNPESWEEAAVQAPVAIAALDFLTTVVQEQDLAVAWDAMDPQLKQSWAAAWVEANSPALAEYGRDLEEVRAALAKGDFEHDLWPHFSRGTLCEVASLVPSNPDWWGIGATARVSGMEVELLYLHDTGGRSDVIWQPGEVKPVVPILMRYSNESWKVLNLGSESFPD
ncbi:MAG TPA: hypothetical protein VGK98_06460 [Arthrobacter sp.]|jgi:hypothetical protein|uniref:hypothetical protein n=1 Tax=Arthrobacter sp. TaxID=1667 RepID=UPI002F405ACB